MQAAKSMPKSMNSQTMPSFLYSSCSRTNMWWLKNCCSFSLVKLMHSCSMLLNWRDEREHYVGIHPDLNYFKWTLKKNPIHQRFQIQQCPAHRWRTVWLVLCPTSDWYGRPSTRTFFHRWIWPMRWQSYIPKSTNHSFAFYCMDQ